MQLFDNPIANAFVVMSLFVAGLGIALYYLKKFAEKQRTHKNEIDLRILSKQPVSQKSQIIIVEAEGKKLMLGVTENNISLISELSDSDKNITDRETSQTPLTQPENNSFSKHFISNLKKQISNQ